MIRKIGYLMGAFAIVAPYHLGLDAFHYSWSVLLFLSGYLVYLSGCGLQKKTDTLLIYNKHRRSIYDYEPLQYWVRIDKRQKKVLLHIKDTQYAYFATLPTAVRIFYPSKKYDIPFDQMAHFIFSKRQTTLTTRGGGFQSFGVIWEIYAKLSDREQLFAESSDEYFMRRLARHIATLTEKPLFDETSIPQARYSPEELNQPYFSSVLKKDLGVRQGLRERRLDLYIRLSDTRNYLLRVLYLFSTVVLYLCYISLIETLAEVVVLSNPMHNFLELGRFGILFACLFIPYIVPLRISFFVSPHGITYLEQIPIFTKSYYFPKDDLYDIAVCELQHSPRKNYSKLLLVSERYTFAVKSTTEELVHLKKNLDAAIKAVLYFHFPEIVELDLPPVSQEISAVEKKNTVSSSVAKEKPFIRFAQRQNDLKSTTPEKQVEIPAPSSEIREEQAFSEKESEISSEQVLLETPFEPEEPATVEESKEIPTDRTVGLDEAREEEKISTYVEEENLPSLQVKTVTTEENALEDQLLTSDEIETIPVVEFEDPEEEEALEAQKIDLLQGEERIDTLEEFSEEPQTLPGEDSFQEGLKLLSEKQIIRAMNAFNDTIRKNPNFVEAYYQKGQIHMKLFEHPEAIECFSDALKVQPRYTLALEARAQAYNEMGDGERSRTDYESLMDLNPERAEEFQQKLDELPF